MTKLFNLSASYSIINDEEQNSLSTMALAWTPHYWFDSNWGVRGQLGFHYLQTKLPGEDSDQFLVTDFGAVGIYHYRHIYLELGLGIQKWSEPESTTYNTTLLGVGYKFPHYVLNFIERAYFNYISVNNELSNTEIHIGLGFSFF